jgi:peptidyl-prolyl cis-trans isomerase SurA
MRTQLIALFLAGLALSSAEVLDRIAVVVGPTAITESEVVREAQVAAFLNGVKPDLSPAGKRKAADRLVEQELLRHEVAQTRFVEPSQSEADRILGEVRGRFATRERYDQALRNYGLSEEDLRSHLIWQWTVLRFTESRFHAGKGTVDEQLDTWLKEARVRTAIEFRKDVFL